MMLKSEKRSGSRSRSSSSVVVDWAYLPEGILDSILNHLIQLSDYLRFATVCKPWLSAAAHQKDHRRRQLHKQTVPFLLITPLPTAAGFMDNDHRRLYSVTQNKFLDFELSVPYRRRFCGSSYGWLAAVNNGDSAVMLLNPFSSESIRFPGANNEFMPVNYRPLSVQNYHQDMVIKVVLSCDPSLMRDDFVVLAIYGTFGQVGYIKPGQKRWTHIERPSFVDAVYHRGKFYALAYNYRLLSIDVSGNVPQVREEVNLFTRFPLGERHKSYVVESSSGEDVLLVQRFHKNEKHPFVRCVTSYFKIFKLLGVDSDEQITEEVEIDSLGDDTLFLGDGFSLCVSASNFPGCQPNCIYYTDDFVYSSMCSHFYEPYYDKGIYSLEHKTLAPHYEVKKTAKQLLTPMPPAQWIVPQLL